jgi:thioredoxin 1
MSVLNITNKDFDQEVLNANGTVLVDFWASWCGPCKMLSPVIDELGSELQGAVKVVKVNIDEQPKLAEQYGVMSIPTLLVMKDGKVQNTSVGYKSKDAIKNMLGI